MHYYFDVFQIYLTVLRLPVCSFSPMQAKDFGLIENIRNYSWVIKFIYVFYGYIIFFSFNYL